MAWGARKSGDACADLVAKISDDSTKAVYILPFRRVTEQGLVAVAAALGSTGVLDELYASGHALPAAAVEAFEAALAANKTLKLLCIGDDTAGDAVFTRLLTALCGHPALATLDCVNKGLRGAALAALPPLLAATPTLTRVLLSNNPLEAAAVAHLAAPSQLTELRLAGCSLSAQALAPLAAAAARGDVALQSLDLSGNALSDHADTDLMTNLGAATGLTELRLNSCDLGPDAVGAFAAARAGAAAHSPLKLELNRNALGAEGIGHALHAGALGGSPAASVASGAAEARSEAQLRWCVSEAAASSDDAAFAALAAATAGASPTGSTLHIDAVDLKGSYLGAHGAAAIAGLLSPPADSGSPLLSAHHLCLFGTELGDAGVAAVLQALEAAAHHHGDHLSTLDVGGVGLTDEGATRLRAWLGDAEGEGEGEAAAARGGGGGPFAALRVLDVSANDLTEEGVAVLTGAVAARGGPLSLLHAGQGEARREEAAEGVPEGAMAAF